MDNVSNLRERLDELELSVARLSKRAEFRTSVTVPPVTAGTELTCNFMSKGGKCLCEVVLIGSEQLQLVMTLDGVVSNFPTAVGVIEKELMKGQHQLKIKCLGANVCGGIMSLNGNNIKIMGGA